MSEKAKGTLSEYDVKKLVKDHKVFWTPVPMQMSIDGYMTRVAISVALAGTDLDKDIKSGNENQPYVLDRLTEIAEWMIPDETPGVRIQIRRGSQNIFYRPEEFHKNWKRYAVGIRILHKGKFAQPFSEDQQAMYEYFQRKLKEIDCPKEHWEDK